MGRFAGSKQKLFGRKPRSTKRLFCVYVRY